MNSPSAERPWVRGQATLPPWLYRLLFLCFYLSGAAGLIYQISWVKALSLVFGKTTYAITAVLCAFMTGLALGSWLLGRYAERARHPLRLYGWIELGIALTGLSSLGGLWVTRWLYLQVYEGLVDQPGLLLGYRFLTSFLVLLIPTTLMGGTYPVVVKYLTRRNEQLGALASRLYWLNTAGAITGAVLAGFVLLWHLGLVRTLVIAASLNLIVAGLVLLSLVRLDATHFTPPSAAGESAAPEEKLVSPGARMILLVAGVSGFTGMMFEIGWTRILAVFLSSTTYAFTLMLATFLFGITLGSYLFERWHQKWELTYNRLGQFLIILALGGVLFLAIGTKLPELMLWLTHASRGSGAALLGSQFLVSFLAMIVPTTLFGLIFPLTVVLYCGGDRRRGARTGALYAVNTLGAIVGAFVTGLFLIQWLNSVNTLLLGSGLNAAVATWLFMGSNPQRSWQRSALGMGVVAVVVAAAATQVFAHPLFHGRTVVANAIRPEFQSGLTVDEIIRTDKYVYVQEGVNATVTVARHEAMVALFTDGKTEGSSVDQQTQLLSAYLPLLLHPRPRRVLVVGFGTGATVYAATQLSGVERVDCVEIEPAVLEAAPYLEELNHGVYKHPKVRVILDDARNYLTVTRQRYDVIINEPSYLWSAGVPQLFTQEFYRQVREHLEPQGLFLQWVQGYQLAPRDLATVLRTLSTTFAHLSLWRGSAADLLILSSPRPRRLSLKTVTAEYNRNAQVRDDLATNLYVDEPAGLLGYYLLDDSALRQWAAQGELNTDDRTVLEYRAPLSIAKRTDQLNHSLVRSLRQEALPSFVELDNRAAAALAGAETQVKLGMLSHSLGAALVPEALKLAPESERTLLLQASVALQERKYLQALDSLQRAERHAPRNARVAFHLARFHLRQGEDEAGRRALEKCLELSPQHREALLILADLEARAGRTNRSIELHLQAIATQPIGLYAVWARLGELYLASGQTQLALEAFQKSLQLEPLGYAAHRNVAALLVESGEIRKAIEEYRFLLQHYPGADAALYLELSALYRKIGNEGAARQTLKKAKRIFPTNPAVERALWNIFSS